MPHSIGEFPTEVNLELIEAVGYFEKTRVEYSTAIWNHKGTKTQRKPTKS